MLESAADPFGEVAEDPCDDKAKTDEIIGRFLGDLRDMDVM